MLAVHTRGVVLSHNTRGEVCTEEANRCMQHDDMEWLQNPKPSHALWVIYIRHHERTPEMSDIVSMEGSGVLKSGVSIDINVNLFIFLTAVYNHPCLVTPHMEPV